LLTEILAALDDDGPRLVYADWLTERGDPRGELIQVQCALAAGGLDDATRAALVLRERELLETHGRDWLLDMLGTMAEGIDIVGSAERPQLGSGAFWHHRGAVAVFRRGFVEALKIPLARFGSADLGPLRCLVLTHASGRDDEQRIAGLVELPCLEALAFRASQLGQVGALALASSGIVRSVRALSLTSAWLADAAAAALVAGPFRRWRSSTSAATCCEPASPRRWRRHRGSRACARSASRDRISATRRRRRSRVRRDGASSASCASTPAASATPASLRSRHRRG
jgi:uncharacterized protein (TIGR02996 family)